jgi:hypothetical protein
MGDAGKDGTEPTAATAAALGGGASNGGGGGGNGSFSSTAPTVGKNASCGTSMPECAGGGGGGGLGQIRVFGVPASSIGGTNSPPPT